jgi:hypothetical protein
MNLEAQHNPECPRPWSASAIPQATGRKNVDSCHPTQPLRVGKTHLQAGHLLRRKGCEETAWQGTQLLPSEGV